MRTDVLKLIHEGHLGVPKCRLRASTSVYWPGVNEDISDLVWQCEICQLSQHRNQKEPLVSVEIPSTPWTKLWCSSMWIKWKTLSSLSRLHVKVPYHEDRLIMRQVPVVIHSIKCVLSEFGIIKEMISENGPCFRSFKSANCCYKLWNCPHNSKSTSSIKHTSCQSWDQDGQGSNLETLWWPLDVITDMEVNSCWWRSQTPCWTTKWTWIPVLLAFN